MPRSPTPPESALTVRALATALLGLLLAGVFLQYAGVVDVIFHRLGTEAIPVPAILAFLGLMVATAPLALLRRRRWLSRAEGVVVLFCLLLAVPLMAHGFWRFLLSVAITLPRTDVELMENWDDRLWPHGPNLLQDALRPEGLSGHEAYGHLEPVPLDIRPGRTVPGLRLRNPTAADASGLRLRLPLERDGRPFLRPGQPYLLSLLARAELVDQAGYFARLWVDDREASDREAFLARELPKVSYVQPAGFRRVGVYALVMPAEAREAVTLEIGLEGEGQVELADPRLVEVSALEDAFTGRRWIRQADYDRLPAGERAGLTLVPDRLFSLAGLGFLLGGYFPWREWAVPVFVWGSFLGLLLTACFALLTLLRRQWVENERYPLPLGQLPFALLGLDDEQPGPVPAILRSRWFWGGAGLAFLWGALRAWHAYNPAVGSFGISIPLATYFDDAGWGKTWNEINWSVTSLFLGLGLLLELNVAISLVLGFLGYRLLYYVGESGGWTADGDYPHGQMQVLGGYLAYAAVSLLLLRKYAVRVLGEAWRGVRPPGEALSPRAALLVLGLVGLGLAAWGRWLNLPGPGLAVLFGFFLVLLVVAAKLRAECGTPDSNFCTHEASYLLPFLGGMTFFGPEGILFGSFFVVLSFEYGLFNLPGVQVEMLEAGRRAGVRGWHLTTWAALGVLGGVLVGGWIFLSSAYSVGAQNFPITGEFNGQQSGLRTWFRTLAEANWTEGLVANPEAGETAGLDPRLTALGGAALVTTVLSFLRQAFAGFWFHPIGLILGPTNAMKEAWGSLLAAWVIRLLVLKLGGAAVIREKLRPVALGLLLGTILAYGVFAAVNGYYYFFNPGAPRFSGRF